MTAASPSETVLLERDGVLVSTTRAVIGGTTYPIASLTAVSVAKIAKGPAGCLPTAMVVGGAIAAAAALIAGVMSVGSGESLATGGGLLVFALIAGALAWFVHGLTTGGPAERHVVRLHTAGLQTDALSSPKPELPNAVAAALNDAIIRRG